MTDMPAAATSNVATAAALDELKRKQEKRAKWSKIGGGLVAFAILLRAGFAIFGPHDAQACDANEVVTNVRTLIDEAAAKGGSNAKITNIDAINTISHDAALNRCTARATMSDRSTGTVTYHVDNKQVQIDGINA